MPKESLPENYTIEGHIEHLREVAHLTTKLLNRDGVDADDRATLSMAFYQIALDTHDSTWTLVDHQLHGPALALLRVTFEAYVRGYFFHHVANQDVIENAYQTGRFGGLSRYIRKISEADKPASEWIKSFGDKFSPFLHDATHGGGVQLGFRIRDGQIQPTYPDQVIYDSLVASTYIFIRAVNELFDLFGDEEGRAEFGNVKVMF